MKDMKLDWSISYWYECMIFKIDDRLKNRQAYMHGLAYIHVFPSCVC